jgi:ABC-type transport system involved in cytochrome c biogenesis permease subunit
MERAVEGLRTLEVQYEGRVQPMGVMCQDAVRRLTGTRDVYEYAPAGCASHDAVFTYVSLVAEPERWKDARIFEIGYRPVRALFGEGLPRRVSFGEVARLGGASDLKGRMATDPRMVEALQGLVMQVEKLARMEDDLAILPGRDSEQPWLVPAEWDKTGGAVGEEVGKAFEELLEAFRARDAGRTSEAVGKLRALVSGTTDSAGTFSGRMRVEYALSRVRLLEVAGWAYVAPLLLGIAALASGRRGMRRTAFVALVVVFALHSAALAGRSYVAGRLPLANTYEYAVMTAWATVLLAIVFERHYERGVFTFLGALLGSVSLAAANVAPISREVSPLMPALRSTWLQYHVLTVFIGYAAFLLACGLSVYYLLGRKKTKEEGGEELLHANDTLIRIGFLFLTLGIMTGCIWANLSWGRYWGWDPKEVWALITWFVYASYLHLGAAGWKRKWVGPAASCVGFGFVIFTYIGVNYVLSGLHSYAN